MELKDIKRIIEMMKLNELTEFELQDQEFRISIKRGNGFDNTMMVSSAQRPMVMPAGAPAGGETVDEEDPYEDIKSPMVGTFYRSPSPDSDAFVNIGQEVDEDTVVCIVEAMKVMNEIKAETRGIIRKILIENASPVEYGQALFKIETS